MIIGYGCYEFKKYMAEVHHKHPEISLMYLGAINDFTIKKILESNQINMYLCAHKEEEPYLTQELRNQFSGKVFEMSKYFVGDNEFMAEDFFADLSLAIQELE